MTIVSMPSLGESVVEGTVGPILAPAGTSVKRDQVVLTILSDKTDSEIVAPHAGVVTKIFAKEGDVLKPGAQLFEIDEKATAAAQASEPAKTAPAAEAPSKPAPTAPTAETKNLHAPSANVPEAFALKEPVHGSPSARKKARELGVDLHAIAAAGPAALLGASAPAPAKTTAPVATDSVLASLTALGLGSFKVPPYTPQPGDKKVPFSRRRRITADHMVYSKLTSPHVVTFSECDLNKTHLLREKNKNTLKAEGINLTFLAFVCAATAKALREFPIMNSRVLDGEYVTMRDIHLGIAVETDDGLVVPVIRSADEKSVRGIARAIDDTATRARDGKLGPDDLAGKTFTVSNPGRKGNLVGGAIISQPNVGILRIGEIKKRVVVVEQDGQDIMAIHPVMYMALSYDHRVVDGSIANAFLFRINELLQLGEFEI